MPNILVIEDDPQFRRLLLRILRSAGHTVTEAQNGKVGMDRCRQQTPDVVITDLLMPEQEGIETIRELRREAPTTPILAISGAIDPVLLHAATALGATASLAKPFAPDELLAAIRDLVDTSRTQGH